MFPKTTVLAATVASLIWLTSPASAQTRPYDEEAVAQEKTADAAGQPSNLPGWAREYELARIDALDAQNRVKDLQRQVPSRSALWKRYRSSPEYLQAQKEFADAYRAYQAARQQVMRDLAQKPEYKNALAMRQELDQRIEKARTGDSQEVLVTLAERKLQHAADASRLESQALAANNQFTEARNRLNDARNRLQNMDKQFDPLKQVPELKQSLDRLESARQDSAQASRHLAGIQAGYRQALEDRAWEYRPRSYYGSYWNYRPWYYYRVDPYYKFRAVPKFPYGWNFNVMGLFNQAK